MNLWFFTGVFSFCSSFCLSLCQSLKLHPKCLLIFISVYYSALPTIDQRDDANTLQRLQIVNQPTRSRRLFILCYFICKHEAQLIYSCMCLFVFSFSWIYFTWSLVILQTLCELMWTLCPCFLFSCTVKKILKWWIILEIYPDVSKMLNYDAFISSAYYTFSKEQTHKVLGTKTKVVETEIFITF